MSALLTTKFRHSLASFLRTSGALNTYWLAVGKPTAFPADASPPDPTDAVQDSHIDVYRNMLFGKYIQPDDSTIMVRRVDWKSGTVYDAYDHTRADMFAASVKFFVVVNEGLSYSVFKCLNNNGGVASTSKPSLYETSADDDFYITSDGYQWKYMYTIPRDIYEKFATLNHIPVVANTAVAANAVNGAIESIEVTNKGSRYNAYFSGSIQVARVGGNNQLFTIESSAASNTDFYKNSVLKITGGPGAGQQRIISDYIVSGGVKRVLVSQPFNVGNMPTEESTYEISPNVILVGDGSDFEGRALVNAVSNTVYAVEITNRGAGYSWANAVVVSNTGYVNSVSNTAVQANNATLRVLISPPGGHGSNPEIELGGTALGVSVTFSTVEAGGKLVSTNDFRTVSVLRNPQLANVVIGIANTIGTFNIGDEVVQPRSSTQGIMNITGTIANIDPGFLTIKNASGVFGVTDTDYTPTPTTSTFLFGNISNASGSVSARIANTNNNNPELYFDQTTTLIANTTSTSSFIEDERLLQGDHANGYVYFANTTVIKLVDTQGVFNISEDGTSTGAVQGSSSQATANTTAIQLPDLVKGSGEVIYIENIAPIARANGQTETIKVVLEF